MNDRPDSGSARDTHAPGPTRKGPPDQTSSERPEHVPTDSLDAVLFDLFYTLVDMRHLPPATATAELLGIDARVWSRTVMEKSPHHALGSERDPVESLRKIAHAIDPSIPLERIREAAAARPGRFRAALVEVRSEILEALARIRSSGLKMGLISNAGLDEIEAWDESPLARFFDVALFSCREGLMKPDVEIYRRAAEQLGTTPGNCVYIGDGGSQEHEGAKAAGMRTILFLDLLQASYPDIAAQRPRVTNWVARTVPDLTTLICRLRESGLP